MIVLMVWRNALVSSGATPTPRSTRPEKSTHRLAVFSGLIIITSRPGKRSSLSLELKVRRNKFLQISVLWDDLPSWITCVDKTRLTSSVFVPHRC